MAKYEYMTLVLRLEEKVFAISADQILQGLKPEGVAALAALGNEEWELVSVLPYSRAIGAEAALAFLKRPKK